MIEIDKNLKNLKEWPRHKELYVSKDGRIYDSSEEKWLSIMTNHAGSIDGPMAIWITNDKHYAINVSLAVYESWIGNISKDYTVKLIDPFSPIGVDNVKKVLKYTKNSKEFKEMSFDGSWMDGSNSSVYMW